MQTLKAARETAGNVSVGNSKMPGTVYSLDAFACNVGSRLAKIEGSVCHQCYARRLQTIRPSVNKGWKRNQATTDAALDHDPDAWSQGVAFQIIKRGVAHHRWLDAGDIPPGKRGRAFLSAVAEVCRMTPKVAHWLPTREAATVRAWCKANELPPNLVVRLSAPMVDDAPVKAPRGVLTSTVHRDAHHGHACPARHQGNQCGDCRACWSHDVANVSYPKH
jgi:hypothetical protein